MLTGQKIIEAMKEAVAGNISTVRIEDQTWIRQHDGKITIPKNAFIVGPTPAGIGEWNPGNYGCCFANNSQAVRVAIWFENWGQASKFVPCLQKPDELG